MRLALAASPWVAIPTLDWLLTSEHELVFIITQPDRHSGRGRKMQSTDVAQWAESQGQTIEILKPEKSEELVDKLTEIDLVITIGYGVIFPEYILTIPKYGFINLHFSLLPQWRGASPVASAILHGDVSSGVTVFHLDSGMDTGPIYIKEELSIGEQENSAQLLNRLAQLGPSVVAKTIEMIENSISPIPQPVTGSSYAKKFHRIDARIDWNKEAKTLERLIRAFTPEPGAWTLWRDQPMRISGAQVNHSGANLAPGEISIMGNQLFVGCLNDEQLEIERLTPAGKKEISVDQWLNGARLGIGEYFV